MTWFKVDDKLHDHRKTRVAGKAAMGVWVLAGSWSADNLTDGFVPESVLTRWGTRADANKLVKAGLWHPDEHEGEKGWRFHEWSEGGRQPTRAETLARREVRAAAGRLGGQASGRTRRGANAKQSASGGASGPVEPPARPGPTAAAAASASGPQTLTDDVPIAILAGKLRRFAALTGLRTDKLRDDQAAQIVELIEIHGDQKLIDSATRTLRRDDPPQTIQAFLPGWLAMPRPGDPSVAAVPDPPCPERGHSGTTRHCPQCASEQKAAR